MDKIDFGGPAFPQEITNNGTKAIHGPTGEIITPSTKAIFFGLFARDYFAAAAAQGILATASVGAGMFRPEFVANEAYKIADAMLAARQQKNAEAKNG